MDTQPTQPGESGSNSSRLAVTLSNRSFIGTQEEWRHQLVHPDAANTATRYWTPDAHWKIVRKTERSTHKKQLTVGSKYIYTIVNGRQLTV